MRSACGVEEPVLVHDGVTSARVTQALHADSSWIIGKPDSGGNATVIKTLNRSTSGLKACKQASTSARNGSCGTGWASAAVDRGIVRCLALLRATMKCQGTQGAGGRQCTASGPASTRPCTGMRPTHRSECA